MTFRRTRRTMVTVSLISALGALMSCGGQTSTTMPGTTFPGTTTGAAGSQSAPPAPSAQSPSVAAASGPDPNAPEIVAPGDIPDNQAFVAYRAAGGFAVKVPEGWARSDLASDHVAFSDKYNSIDLTWVTAPTAPTEAAASSALQALALPAYRFVAAVTVQRPAGPAVLITYQRTSEPNAVTGKRITLDVEQYQFSKNGTTATLTLSGATGSDNVDPWKTVTEGFGWNA